MIPKVPSPTSDKKYVLIVAEHGDVHAETVAKRIEETGKALPILIEPSTFPSRSCLSVHVPQDGRWNLMLKFGEHVLNEKDILSVWWRRYGGHDISSVADAESRLFAERETTQLFRGLFCTFRPKIIDSPEAVQFASQKVVQLFHAKECGLEIPETLITNSSEDLRAFYKSNHGGIIFKTLTHATSSMAETRRFCPEYFEALETLKYAPCIFQRMVERGSDIRATVVGEEVFSVEVIPHKPEAQIDWRLDEAVDVRPWSLPKSIQNKLISLTQKLGLRYGAADLRLDPLGNYMFFEINPGGQFLFAEIMAGQPISSALARLLVSM